MKRYILPVILLAACQPDVTDVELASEDGVTADSTVTVQADIVRLRLNEPVSEPRACIIPIQIENGLDNETRVTVIGFDLSGPGEDAKGNMFAPAAGPGEISEARVIVQGQSCDAFEVITLPEIRCTSGEESCTDKVELIDGARLRFSKTG